MSQEFFDPNVELPKSTPWSKLAAVLVFATVMILVLAFDQVKEAAGRFYYERKIPKTLDEKKIIQSLGTPDKFCAGEKECVEFLDSFIFRKTQPAFSTYFAYTNHYPLLPLLVFYKDESGQVLGYDFGVN